MNIMTADKVIKSRQAEIINEVMEIEQKIRALQEEIDSLKILQEKRTFEHQLLEGLEERATINVTSQITRRKQKLSFEDTIIQIYNRIGRPMKVGELIKELEKYGYIWSTYYGAYQYITTRDIIKSTGARGYYNVIANRGW